MLRIEKRIKWFKEKQFYAFLSSLTFLFNLLKLLVIMMIAKTAIIVTSGYGTWGPPLRIGTRSEIVSIDLAGRN